MEEEQQGSAELIFTEQEFRSFRKAIGDHPDYHSDLASAKSDEDGFFCLKFTLDQLDALHYMAGDMLDTVRTKAQRELWDGIWIQLGSALDEAAMSSEDMQEEIWGEDDE